MTTKHLGVYFIGLHCCPFHRTKYH